MASALIVPGDCCGDCGCDSTITISNTVGYFAVDTLAALRAVTSSALNKVANMAGLNSAGDGSGRIYFWDNNSVLADNGTTVIKPNDNPATGRWRAMPGIP